MSLSLWVPFAEEAVATIYCLAEHPDRLSTVLLMRLCHEVAPSPGEGGFDTQRPPEPTLRDFDGDFDPEMVSTQGIYIYIHTYIDTWVDPYSHLRNGKVE